MHVIRRDTDYAIRGLLHLARSNGRRLSCTTLARVCNVPRSFAHKILRRLTTARIVNSCTGRSGGFALNRPPEAIHLSHVVNAIQGSIAISRCVVNPRVCSLSDGCPLSTKWYELQSRIVQFLENTTLQDVLQHSESPARKPGQR